MYPTRFHRPAAGFRKRRFPAAVLVFVVALSGCETEEEKYERENRPSDDLSLLYETEMFFPLIDIRQGRQKTLHLKDISQPEDRANEDSPYDVYVTLERHDSSFGSVGAGSLSVTTHVRRSRDGGRTFSDAPHVFDGDARVLGIAQSAADPGVLALRPLRTKDRYAPVAQPVLYEYGNDGLSPVGPPFTEILGAHGGGLHGVTSYQYEGVTHAFPTGGTVSRVLSTEGSRTLWTGPAALLPGRFHGMSAERFSFQPLSVSFFRDTPTDNAAPVGIHRNAQPFTTSLAEWPLRFTNGDPHVFSDGSTAIVAEKGILLVDDEVARSHMSLLRTGRLRTSPFVLRPLVSGVLRVFSDSPLALEGASPEPDRFIDRKNGAWVERHFPMTLCAKSPCDLDKNVELVGAQRLHADDWLLVYSSRGEGFIVQEIDGEFVSQPSTRLRLLSRRATVRSSPWTDIDTDVDQNARFGPNSLPAGELQKVFYARRFCLADRLKTTLSWQLFDELCQGPECDTLARYSDDCPTRRKLLDQARRGATCDEWLAPAVAPECEMPLPDDCTPGAAYRRCSDDSRVFESCVTDRGRTHYLRRDCGGLDLECDAGDGTGCRFEQAEARAGPVVLEAFLCQNGRHLLFPQRNSAGSQVGTRWLDCQALGFAGCAADQGGHRTSRCVVEMPP